MPPKRTIHPRNKHIFYDLISGEHIKVIVEDLSTHPHCAHGPTLLFRRTHHHSNRVDEFYACSACRNRKECAFYVEKGNYKRPNQISSVQSVDKMNEQDALLEKVNCVTNAIESL